MQHHHHYDEDVFAWAKEQVQHLQARRFDLLDIENLIEEIESVTRSEKRAMESYFVILLMHLLKIKCQPAKHSRSWNLSIRNAQREIQHILRDSPSLKPFIQQVFDAAYSYAIEDASTETGLPAKTFPSICPWTVEEALNWQPKISSR